MLQYLFLSPVLKGLKILSHLPDGNIKKLVKQHCKKGSFLNRFREFTNLSMIKPGLRQNSRCTIIPSETQKLHVWSHLIAVAQVGGKVKLQMGAPQRGQTKGWQI